MNHNEAVRENATEKYLLNELDPAVRDQFEEHLFDCQECALDLRTAATFVEQSKVILSEGPADISGASVRLRTCKLRMVCLAKACVCRASVGPLAGDYRISKSDLLSRLQTCGQ